ncbi:Predicted arabinose efflux permease, MFS family [Halobacillus dabanensis]|uniref:Predicted arabinose efflux permease, MFS family n=1 Tax=Halobacillus dabanensis TaxID=240302 RepID=A0A1I3WPF2_HALDA|nr:MFS transporter [Halobacillus dabanensis]SFK09250.1 Predicted arabinose efflux permease, MFS family [Halobacillus dabanensis]
MKRLMKNKGYMTLMSAQAISSIGDWLSIVAIITLVGLKWNASPLQVSFVFLCLAVPMALFGPVAGIIADRFSRKTLMIASDVVRAALILVLTIATSLWMVYATLLTIGIFSALFIPAKNGKLKEVVAEEDMKGAMSITSMIDSSTKILGPLISGLLVTVFGAQQVFIIDSATFLVSAVILLFIPNAVRLETLDEEKEESSFKQEFVLGFSFLKSSRFMMTGLILVGLSLLILQSADSQLIVLIRELSYASPDLFGYLVTGSGFGMFLAGFLLAKKTDYKAYPLMLLGVCGIGASFGIMGLLTHYDLSYSIIWGPALGFTAGFSASLIFVPFQATVQVNTPVHMTGRVFGVINSVMTTATIIGPLLGGWIATIIGVIPTFTITASLLIFVSLIGWMTKRKVERGNADVSKSKQGAPEATTS